MAFIQYQRKVYWDAALADVGFDSNGLVTDALKTTTGAPTATAGKFEKACQIQNIVDGTWYENTGTVAAPVWSLVPGSGSGMTQLTGDVTAGPGTGSQVATIAALAVDNGKLAASAVTNSKVAAAAAIAFSKLAALPSAQILVGSAGNVPTAVAMSGDATISNTGAVTVASSAGTFTVGGRFIGTVTASSGPGAVAITGLLHEITTTGTGDAMTLANGAAGQMLNIIYVAEAAGADTAVLTPTTLAGGNTITFNALGDTAQLVYSSTGGWYMIGGSAVLA